MAFWKRKKPVKIATLTCLRCGYGSGKQLWIPRVPSPKRCPKCNSPYWDREREPGTKHPEARQVED